MGKVRYMGKAAWPIYRYWCKSGYPRAIASVLGSAAGVAITIIGLLAAGTGAWLAITLLAAAGAGCAGALANRLLFFSTRREDVTCGVIAAACGGAIASGFSLLGAGGLLLLPIVIAVTEAFLHRGGPVSLYTDGFTVDGHVFMYDDVIVTSWGSGRAVDENVPTEGQGKPVIRLTALDYEHVEKEFGITHFYAYVVTPGAVHVIQPLRHRSEFVGNVRNAWACNDYEKRTKTGPPPA